MCGIFFILARSGHFSEAEMEAILDASKTLQPRGPDAMRIHQVHSGMLMVFHRLAINDLSSAGMQPFVWNQHHVMCNGEIYNADTLLQRHPEWQERLGSHSDCELLPHLIDTYGWEAALREIDGVYALLHLNEQTGTIRFARDRFGVKPLFWSQSQQWIMVASEAKAIDALLPVDPGMRLFPLVPSSYGEIDPEMFSVMIHPLPSHALPSPSSSSRPLPSLPSYEAASVHVAKRLEQAIAKRITSDREIGCLLSGGLDSSLVAAILAKQLRSRGQTLHTFSVGFPDSVDIQYARVVANHIQSEHHELILSYADALERIPDVIRATETYDTTTVRASTPMFLLCEWISQHFPHRVIFSGEGSDELFGGYLYFHLAPNAEESFLDRLRLLRQLWMYDVLRADRCTASNGLEFREPFLDRDLVDDVLQLPSEWLSPKDGFEKHLLRSGIDADLLPSSVLWRRKAAFSDAVSSGEKPWYVYIQEYIQKQSCPMPNDFSARTRFVDEAPTAESRFYRWQFVHHFHEFRPIIPLWLPQWSQVGAEPSATVLPVWNQNEHIVNLSST